jgi:hypothetical protein
MEKDNAVYFKTSNSIKSGLEMLALKNGVSVPHFLNDLIFNAIKAEIVSEAQTTALWDAILELELPHHLYAELKDFHNFWENVNTILGEKKGKQFGERWKQLLFQEISNGCQRLGFVDLDKAYNEAINILEEK